MPLFEYKCKKCAHSFEALVYGDEEAECPECKSQKLERLLSMPAKPQSSFADFPSACGDPSLPPCGAPGCRRTGKPL
ncbi:MAG: zinc ribbon domain-containing protein [Gemmataceae bacterium]|nr:zinc ribbon domain-containing protein [Gemmataceae bacterium]MCI0740349.1 zinc ribbon domain-containing protein [Gemmataceae bacterium]